MTLELLLLCALIFVFILSFCGLLQKIKQSYERERIIAAQFYAERMARSHSPRQRSSEDYINSTFVEDFESVSGIFPSAPPPYSHLEAPPKYEDIIKTETTAVESVEPTIAQQTSVVPATAPPPYTISA